MTAIGVLIVEDQPTILKKLLKSLSLYSDITVIGTALTGEEGLEFLASRRPDVVLLDLELPGVNGIEVARHISSNYRGVEILILTSFKDSERVFSAIKAGASGYLVKQVSMDKIAEGIREVYRGGTVLEAGIARRFFNYFQSVKPAEDLLPLPSTLTEDEAEVLQLIAKGLTNAEVGNTMNIKHRTVRTLLRKIYDKLEVDSRVAAVREGLRLRIVKL